MGVVARIFLALVCSVLLAGCARDDAGDIAPATSSAAAGNSATSAPSSAAALPADYQPIPGTRIALRVPERMQVEPTLPGLERTGTRTSVVVLDQQRPTGDPPGKVLDEMANSFQIRGAREGIQFGDPQRTEVAGHPAVLATGTQTVAGTTFGKAMVAIATEDSIVFMTGTVERGDPLDADGLLAVLRDARWTGERAPSDLGIEITPAPGYQMVPSSSAVLVSLGGAGGTDVPMFQASPSMGKAPVPTEQRRAFTEQRFQQLPGNPSPQTVTEATIADLPGWEVIGGTADEVVYAVMLFTADRYVVLVGMQPKGQPDQLPAFRQMANSLVLSR